MVPGVVNGPLSSHEKPDAPLFRSAAYWSGIGLRFDLPRLHTARRFFRLARIIDAQRVVMSWTSQTDLLQVLFVTICVCMIFVGYNAGNRM